MEVDLYGRKFSLEEPLMQKIDLLCDRVTRQHPKADSTLGIDGATGSGKTNGSIVIAGIVRQITGRPINLFFSAKSTIEFAQSTEGQLIIMDEPSLDLLARDWATTSSKDFLRLTNTMRKKRHFFIANLVNFWLFSENLIVDRLHGFLHTYEKRNGSPGKFLYIRKSKLQLLWNDYKKLHIRNYSKYKSFNGEFPYIMEDGTFEKLDISIEGKPHCTYKDYEDLKDKSIGSIGTAKEKKDKNFIKLWELRKKIALLNFDKLGIKREEFASMLGLASARLREWAFKVENDPNLLEKEGFEG